MLVLAALQLMCICEPIRWAFIIHWWFIFYIHLAHNFFRSFCSFRYAFMLCMWHVITYMLSPQYWKKEKKRNVYFRHLVHTKNTFVANELGFYRSHIHSVHFSRTREFYITANWLFNRIRATVENHLKQFTIFEAKLVN